jgi:hypothetical protein
MGVGWNSFNMDDTFKPGFQNQLGLANGSKIIKNLLHHDVSLAFWFSFWMHTQLEGKFTVWVRCKNM